MAGTPAPQIISHYQVESLLGVGAMGSVYLGIDRRDGTLVAIKLIASFLAQDSEFRGRFEREAHVAALLRSPYTVRVLEYGVEEGRVYMAIEYVDGPAVRELLESGPLEPGRAARIALQVARALEEAEARGIVHRDIKPDNILLGPEDTAKLADFGVARQEASRLTQTGGFYGTAAYAAPEQFGGHADSRSDIYALGASLYHTLLGRPVVSGDLEQARRRVIAGDIAFSDLAQWPELREVIEKAMHTDPEQRYQTARQMAGALEGALASLGGSSNAALATVVGAPATEGDWRSEEESLRLALKGPATSLPFGKRYASQKYELEVTNQGQEEARVRLRAADRANACSFALAEAVSVPAGATSHVAFKVKPQKRRLRGPDLTRIFTVAASRGGGGGGGVGDSGGGGDGDGSGASGGGPPSTVSGRFEDSSYGWLPLGMSGVALVVAAVALLVATVGTGASGDEEPQALKIGLLMPFSGLRFEGGPSWEEYGQAYLNAARIAVGEINADGGVLGHPVTLVQGDSAGDTNVGVAEAQRLIDQEQVHAIIGDANVSSTLDIANQITNPAGVVLITPNSVTEAFDSQGRPVESDLPFLFKTETRPEAEGVALAQLIEEEGYRKVCSIYDQSSGTATNTNDALKRFASDAQIVEVTHQITLDGTGLEFEPRTEAELAAVFREFAVSEIAQCEGADALVLNVYADLAPPATEGDAQALTSYLVEEALDRGLGPILLSSSLAEEFIVGTSEEPPTEVGEAQSFASFHIFDRIGWDRSAGIRGTRLGQSGGRQGENFDTVYATQFGQPPAGLDDPSRFPADLRSVYDSVYLIALAAETAGSTDPDAIRAALPEVANAPGTVVRPGSDTSSLSDGGEFKRARDLIASGEDLDYEGATGPVEFDKDRNNVRGAVDIWSLDAQAQALITERTLIVDLLSDQTGATPPGEVHTSAFAVPVTLTAAPGFEVIEDRAAREFRLERLGSEDGPDAYLSFLSPISVANESGEPEPVPNDLASSLEGHPGVVVRAASDVTIGGQQGRQLDVKGGDTGPPLALVLGSQQVGPDEESFIEYFLVPGEFARLVILDIDGQLVVIAGGVLDHDPPYDQADFNAVIPHIETMLKTVQFGADE